ncbi:C-C motif chemokine 25 [Diretmus argenteus]
MRVNVLFFLLILTCLYLTLAQGSFEDCCLKYVKKLSKGTERMAVKYRVQQRDGGCNIPAIVFTMKRGREFCANPSEMWVRELIKKIDKKNHRKYRRQGPKSG